MNTVAQAREMAAKSQWPPMLDGYVDPEEVAACLSGLTGESVIRLAQAACPSGRTPAGRPISTATLAELLDAIEAAQ